MPPRTGIRHLELPTTVLARELDHALSLPDPSQPSQHGPESQRVPTFEATGLSELHTLRARYPQ